MTELSQDEQIQYLLSMLMIIIYRYHNKKITLDNLSEFSGHKMYIDFKLDTETNSATLIVKEGLPPTQNN